MKLALVVTLCLIALLGCAPTAAEPEPSKTVEPTRSETPTPTPTPEPTTKPSLTELHISPDGLGPLVIGRPAGADNPETDIVYWDETFCGFDVPADDYAGWATNYPADASWHYPFLAEVTYVDGTTESAIERITVQSPMIRTAEGLGIGSSVADLEAQYGDDLVRYPEDYYYPLTVVGANGQLVFWIYLEEPTEVYMMQVLDDFDPPAWSFHLTGCA